MYFVSNFSCFTEWQTISDDINAASDRNVHYTGKSGQLTKRFSHDIYTDGNLEINSRTNNITINGDIYCDGDLTLSAYGCKLTVNGNIYTKGDLTFATNGDTTVNGSIYCCKDIKSNGGSIGKINCSYVYCNNFIPGGHADISGYTGRMKSVECFEGEQIQEKVRRIVNNNEPITDGAPIIFTEKKDGVLPEYNLS